MSTSNTDKLQPDAPFEQVLGRLEQLVEELERGDQPLEQSLATFEEGIVLARLGSKRLDDAEQRVEFLLSRGDEETAGSPGGEEPLAS